MTRAPLLFGALERAPRTRRMHVVDAGNFPDGRAAIHFQCSHCGHDEGWTDQAETLTQARRGRRCPRCNP